MLCYFAHQFPSSVEAFLDASLGLKRRFREESVTDVMMGSLITAGGLRIIVEFPNEAATGADMEWNFVNPTHGTFFRLLLQANRCMEEARSGGVIATGTFFTACRRAAGSRRKFSATQPVPALRRIRSTFSIIHAARARSRTSRGALWSPERLSPMVT
jgi:hypothetical protein